MTDVDFETPEEFEGEIELPAKLPVLALKDTVVFPQPGEPVKRRSVPAPMRRIMTGLRWLGPPRRSDRSWAYFRPRPVTPQGMGLTSALTMFAAHV